MAGKQYDVIRWFRRVDPRTGDETIHEPGGTYSGSVDADYFLYPSGPDGQGPLLAEKPNSGASSSADKSATSSSDSGKEK